MKISNSNCRWTASLGVAVLLWSASLAEAQEVLRYEAKAIGSKVKVEGTSTIHDWTVESRIVGGFMEIDTKFMTDPAFKPAAGLKLTPKVEVNIPVRSVKSDKPRMDEVMHEAMKEPANKNIQYRLKEMTLTEVPANPDGLFKFDTTGDLTVSGVTKSIQMPVTLHKAGADAVKVMGEIKLKMTDFGIKPPAPSIALGLIKTGDDVKVSFEWLTAKKKAASAQKTP